MTKCIITISITISRGNDVKCCDVVGQSLPPSPSPVSVLLPSLLREEETGIFLCKALQQDLVRLPAISLHGIDESKSSDIPRQSTDDVSRASEPMREIKGFPEDFVSQLSIIDIIQDYIKQKIHNWKLASEIGWWSQQ